MSFARRSRPMSASSRRSAFVAVVNSPMSMSSPPAISASACSHQTASVAARRMIRL